VSKTNNKIHDISQKDLYCPQCLATNVVKNGIKRTSGQNYLCKKCGKQFQREYLYWVCYSQVKSLVIRMLVNRSGISTVARVLKTSIGCVLRTLVKAGQLVDIRPQKTHCHKAQIDELYGFVETRTKKCGLSTLTMPKARKYWP